MPSSAWKKIHADIRSHPREQEMRNPRAAQNEIQVFIHESAVAVLNDHAVRRRFFNDTATTETYPLPLHDALPIFPSAVFSSVWIRNHGRSSFSKTSRLIKRQDRKSTRLNSSHGYLSHAVFCL